MKFSAIIAAAGAVSLTKAMPQFASSRDFVPKEWIAPGPGDCELSDRHVFRAPVPLC